MIDRLLNFGRPQIRNFLKHIPQANTILDIGAGSGADLSIAKEIHPHAKPLGVEGFSPYAQKLRSQGVNIYELNIEKDPLPFEAESIDVVMANQVLEHIKEIFWIFDQLSKVIKVNGHLIVGVPNLASLHNRILLSVGSQPTSIRVSSAHVRGFTRRGLLQFFKDVAPGLYTLEKYQGANFYPFPPVLAKPLAKLCPGMAVGTFMLFQKKRSYQGEFLEFAAPGKLETNYYIGQR
jgi:hypothetical protein